MFTGIVELLDFARAYVVLVNKAACRNGRRSGVVELMSELNEAKN